MAHFGVRLLQRSEIQSFAACGRFRRLDRTRSLRARSHMLDRRKGDEDRPWLADCDYVVVPAVSRFFGIVIAICSSTPRPAALSRESRRGQPRFGSTRCRCSRAHLGGVSCASCWRGPRCIRSSRGRPGSRGTVERLQPTLRCNDRADAGHHRRRRRAPSRAAATFADGLQDGGLALRCRSRAGHAVGACSYGRLARRRPRCLINGR